MPQDPVTGAAAVAAYRGTRTVRAPWPKVKVDLRADVPGWLGEPAANVEQRVRGGAQIVPFSW